MLRLTHSDGSPHLENIALLEQRMRETIALQEQREEKIRYWQSVLWSGARSHSWICALIEENVADISGITWPLILRVEKDKKYQNLGKTGGDRLAAVAGLAPRPQWVSPDAIFAALDALVRADLAAVSEGKIEETAELRAAAKLVGAASVFHRCR